MELVKYPFVGGISALVAVSCLPDYVFLFSLKYGISLGGVSVLF